MNRRRYSQSSFQIRYMKSNGPYVCQTHLTVNVKTRCAGHAGYIYLDRKISILPRALRTIQNSWYIQSNTWGRQHVHIYSIHITRLMWEPDNGHSIRPEVFIKFTMFVVISCAPNAAGIFPVLFFANLLNVFNRPPLSAISTKKFQSFSLPRILIQNENIEKSI